ncbi:MAG: hypothetical protein ABIP94_09160, partial [Planctomycetota bacterium]
MSIVPYRQRSSQHAGVCGSPNVPLRAFRGRTTRLPRYNGAMAKRLFLIDGTALAYRSFFAF